METQAGRAAEGPRLSAPAGAELPALAARLKEAATMRGVTVGTAESCTGGLIGHAVTSVAGASGYYRGGVVSYADAVKIDLLDVPATTIERHGAVSAQVAVAMAEGARGRIGCDFAVAVTGVAGPDGGTAAKPVGLAYVAAAGPAGHEVRRCLWHGDRAANNEASAGAALELLLTLIEGTGA